MELRSQEFWRALSWLLGLIAASLAVLSVLLYLRLSEELARPRPGEVIEPPPDRVRLRRVAFSALPEWDRDRLTETLPALQSSCRALQRLPDGRPVGSDQLPLTAGQWSGFCRRIASLTEANEQQVRRLVEMELEPWQITNRGDPYGLFTGYFEPTLRGSRHPDERFRFPLYLRPPELIEVDLGEFREDLRGRRIAGRVAGQTLVPFLDRAAIDDGGLEDRELELVWVDSAIDAFFLHIQGSGRVELEEGGSLRVGYASQNGHPYTAIGRELVDRDELLLDELSMQTIREWLARHPEEAGKLMQSNASYVFFRELHESGPVGSQGVVLTPRRSMAVDRHFLPLGAPIWIDTTIPSAEPGVPEHPLRRLVVAQDTGGAIRGPVRGDIFWGSGATAAEIAGRMRQPGRMWILLPRGWSLTGNAPPRGSL